MRLRVRLWASHGHDGLYGDDGELQCSRCGLDFKRADFEDILNRLDEVDRERFAAQHSVLCQVRTVYMNAPALCLRMANHDGPHEWAPATGNEV